MDGLKLGLEAAAGLGVDDLVRLADVFAFGGPDSSLFEVGMGVNAVDSLFTNNGTVANDELHLCMAPVPDVNMWLEFQANALQRLDERKPALDDVQARAGVQIEQVECEKGVVAVGERIVNSLMISLHSVCQPAGSRADLSILRIHDMQAVFLTPTCRWPDLGQRPRTAASSTSRTASFPRGSGSSRLQDMYD